MMFKIELCFISDMDFEGGFGFRHSFRPLDTGSEGYGEALLSSPSRLMKRSLFSDLPLSGGQYLQGYSPSHRRKSVQSTSHPYGGPGFHFGLENFSEDHSPQESWEPSLSNGTTPDLAPSFSTSPRQPFRVIPVPAPVQQQYKPPVGGEYRSGCRGVSWNRRMKAWLAFWTEGKVRRSKTFNAKLLGFDQAREQAIDFLREKKALLHLNLSAESPDSSRGSPTEEPVTEGYTFSDVLPWNENL